MTFHLGWNGPHGDTFHVGWLVDAEGGGGSNDPHKYGKYSSKPRLGFGGGLALLNARACETKKELDERPELKRRVYQAVVKASKNTGVTPFTVTEKSERPPSFRAAVRKDLTEFVSETEPLEAVSIDEVIRWFEWIKQMEDEEDIALLLLMM